MCCDEDDDVMMPMTSPAVQIQVIRNSIYLYDDINAMITRGLIGALNSLALSMVSDAVESGYNIPPIKLHINSNGGSVPDALAIVDCIEKIKSGETTSIGGVKIPIEVWTYIEGEADSSASLIACTGSKRFMSKYAMSLIHPMRQISSGAASRVEDVETQAKNLSKFQNIFKEIYVKNSKLKPKELDKIMSNEEYNTPKELLEFGLIDEII